MAKELRCAKCGAVLNTGLVGVPQIGQVIQVVEPHTCTEDVADFTVPVPERPALERKLDKERLAGYPFSQKLSEVRKSALMQVMPEDRRPNTREEFAVSNNKTTTAPENILQAFARDDFSSGGEMEG